jgi:transcriptional regulator with XRE-family HTH domain
MTIGEKLKGLRVARHLSLRRLSEELKRQGLEVSYAAIHKWETDEALPTRKHLSAVCAYFSVEAAWLMFSVSGKSDDQVIQAAIDEFKMLSYSRQKTVAKIIKIFTEDDANDNRPFTDVPAANEPFGGKDG